MISPEIRREVASSLDKLKYVTIITDTSNRKAEKMLPIIVRGFDEEKGVVVYHLQLKIIMNEKSDTVGTELIATAKEWNVEDKLIGFGADNCPTNFGSFKRNGTNNVFARLKVELGRDIVGIGCAAHIIHNAFDVACDQLPVDIESLVVNVYKHFHIHTIRTESLKDFCSGADVEYETLTNHSGTRFLTLLPAVSKVSLRNFRITNDILLL